MADDENEGESTQPRGADWEVVSLTASTYAAAPNPKGLNLNEDKDDGNKQGASSSMFMSSHFVFPPSEHENLPIQTGYTEIHKEQDIGSGEEEGGEEKQDIGFSEEEGGEEKQDELDEGTEFFDEGSTMELEENKGLQGLCAVAYPDSSNIDDPIDSLDQDLNPPQKNMKTSEEDNYGGSGHPCASWWKKHASSLYQHAKEANTFWSIFVAAALTGLVILGKRWHRDKCHAEELRRHLCVSDECHKMSGVMGPLGRLKNIIVSSHPRSPVIAGGVAASH